MLFSFQISFFKAIPEKGPTPSLSRVFAYSRSAKKGNFLQLSAWGQKKRLVVRGSTEPISVIQLCALPRSQVIVLKAQPCLDTRHSGVSLLCNFPSPR